MAFTLGALEVTPDITLIAFLLIISFIVFFDFFTKFLEFSLEDSPRYNRMVQNIYKELMQMGIVSFLFVLYESSSEIDSTDTESSNNQSSSNLQWLSALDFSHILLFFVAIYFVVHTFYLIRVSIRTANLYARLNAENSYELTTTKSQLSWFQNLCFNLEFIPSSFREKFEYKLLQVLLRETFVRLPEDFSFNLYLSKSFEQYSLKIMEFGIFSWAVVFMLALANYIRTRIKGSLDCTIDPEKCGNIIIYILIIVAIILVSYILIVMAVGRIYELRLIRYVGVNGSSEYDDFLHFVSREEKIKLQKQHYNLNTSSSLMIIDRFSAENLKQMVDDFVDAKENNEENQLYRKISNLWSHFWMKVIDFGYSVQMWYRLRNIRKIDPDISPISRKPSILSRVSDDEDLDSEESSQTETKRGSLRGNPNGNINAREKIQASLQMRPRSHSIPSVAVSESIAAKVVKTLLQKNRENSNSNLIILPVDIEVAQKTLALDIGESSNFLSERARHIEEEISGKQTSRLPLNTFRRNNQSKRIKDTFGNAIRGPSPNHDQNKGSSKGSTKISTHRTSSETSRVPKVPNTHASANTGDIEQETFFQKYVKYKERNKTELVSRWSLPIHKKTHEPKPLPQDFNDIFFLKNPQYFFRVVEIALMGNSFFLALGTYFIQPMMKQIDNTTLLLILFIPLIITFPCIGRIVKVASLIKAVTELQLEVIRDVLTEAEDMKVLSDELRSKIFAKLDGLHEQIAQPALTKKAANAATALKQDIIHRLFMEIDVDGNGVVDKLEFRNLLSMLQLQYSDKRFQRLFKAVDVKAKGKLGIADLEALLFPPENIIRKTRASTSKIHKITNTNNTCQLKGEYASAHVGSLVGSERRGTSMKTPLTYKINSTRDESPV